MKTREEITRMKRELYVALLGWPWDRLTDSDVNLIEMFAMDPDIQAILERARKEEGGK